MAQDRAFAVNSVKSAVKPSAQTDGAAGESDTLGVLLIEDNAADARLAEHMLREDPDRMAVEIETCSTLAGAAQLLGAGAGRFDVVLLDLSLPDSTGVSTFHDVLALAPNLPIVILSGLTDEEMAIQLVSLGAQDYLLKDAMEPATIRRSIHYAIERKASSEKLQLLNADLERKNEELRTMQLQLIQAEKMESVGRLAAGVAHEVKNPLAMIQLGVDYLMEGVVADDPNLPKILGRMQNAITRADAIICGLVDFSSARQLNLEMGDLNALAESSLLLVRHELAKKEIEVETSLDPALPKVKADRGKMEQVLINVYMNAIQSMEPGGRLRISTASEMLEESLQPTRSNRAVDRLRSGVPVVVLRVDDSGRGLPPDKIGEIFDPFFTTKDTGEGTGLGLTVVKKIIELHNGGISLQNRPEGGCRAQITLAAVPSEA